MFFDFFSQIDQHAMAILQGMQEAQKLKLFDDYRVTFTVNKTKKPFILPISGLYHDTPLDSHMQDRLKHQTEMGIVEHIAGASMFFPAAYTVLLANPAFTQELSGWIVRQIKSCCLSTCGRKVRRELR